MTHAFKTLRSEPNLVFPTFFASVSSVKTQLAPLDYLRLIHAVGYNHVLLSTYDIYHASVEDREVISALLKGALEEKDTVILLDSGRYESFWHRDASWTWDLHISVLNACPYHMCFSYDTDQDATEAADIARQVVEGVRRDQCAGGHVIPIVHGPQEQLPEACYLVASELKPEMIAVAERDLGDGVFSRARTLRKIRLSLDRLTFDCPIHVLGTGHPISVLLFAFVGANSFDGLEWCQTAIEPTSALCHHFHQFDLFRGHMPEQLADLDLSYHVNVLASNLLFMQGWMAALRQAISDGSIMTMVKEHLSPEAFQDFMSRMELTPG